MKYNVTAKLEVYFSREVEVDADSEEEAEAKVIELMGTPDWKYPNVLRDPLGRASGVEGYNWEVDPSWGHQDVSVRPVGLGCEIEVSLS